MQNIIVARSLVLANGFTRNTHLSPVCTPRHAERFLDQVAATLEAEGYAIKPEEDGFTALMANGRGFKYQILGA